MAQAQVGKIKLVSMEIVDFKTLQKGTISWDFSSDGHFGIIAVQDFVDRSTMFQAFQFGFGHETDAPNAEVIVVLQRQLDNHVERWKFKHSKKLLGRQTVTKFGFQTTGFDDDFQDVDQERYFKELADLEIFASNQVFLMKGNSQEVLASDALDLRPFLEMYLLHKPHLDPNYDRTDELVQTLFEQKKEENQNLGQIKKNRKNYELESTDQQNAFKAESSEKDALLLQMFYHLKSDEEVDEGFGDKPEPGNLKKKLRCLDKIIDEKSLHNQMQNRSEANINSWNKFVEEKQNEIVRQLESINSDIDTLTSASSDVLNRFATAYGECKSDLLEAEIKAENARFKLEKAKLELKISEITEEWESLQRKTEDMTERKKGARLIGIKAIEKRETSIYLDALKNDVADTIEQDNLFHGQHEFDVPKMSEENFRKFMTKLPKSGQIVLRTIYEMNDTITKVLEDDAIVGDRFVMVHLKDPNSNLKRNPFFTGTTVTGEPDPDDFDKVPDTAKLQKKLDEFETYDNLGIRELVQKIEKKEYFVPKVSENNPNVVQTGDQIENLKKELVDAQGELGALYQTRFGDISQDLGFPSVDSAANFCNAFAHLGVLTDQNVKDVIDDLKAMKIQLQQQHQQLQQHMAEILPLQGTRIDRMTLDELLNHGKQIAKLVEDCIEYMNNVFHLKFQVAKRANIDSAVEYVNELLRINALVKDWDLPFDPDIEHSTDTYFDCISEQYKEDFNAADMSISKAFDIVGTHVMKIKQAIAKYKHKSDRIHGNDAALRALEKMLKRSQINIKNKMVASKRAFDVRVNTFTEKFVNFLPTFQSLVNICSQHWQMNLSLDYSTALSPLLEPILLLVSDPTLDQSYNEMTTLNHHAAAIILKLAINLAIGSPILIFDSIDYIVEERLKNPIMKLLEKLVNDHGIQVFFMMVKSQEDLPTGNVHQIWSQLNRRSRMMEDYIADITALKHPPAQ